MALGLGLGLPFFQAVFGNGGSDPSKAIDDIIDAAGPSLFQFNDASTYDDGTGSWPDSSGNGREMTPQSGAVAPGTSTLNGRPAVQFGASNRLTSVAAAADYLPLINRAGRAVIYMVLDMDDSVGQDMYLFNMGSSGSGMWNGYVDVSSSERAFTLLRDNTGGVATNIGLGGIGVPTGIRNQFLKVSADTEADMVSVSNEGNTSRNPAALSGTAPASLASTLVLGGLNTGSLSFPMSGPVSAFIILLDPTEEQENAVEVVLRREYLKQPSVLVDIVEAAGSSLYQFNDAEVYNEGTGDWLDTSINGRDMIPQTTAPGTTTLNGRPALQFNALEIMKSVAPQADYALFHNAAGDCRVYMVCDFEDTGTFSAPFATNPATGNGGVRSLIRQDQGSVWHVGIYGLATVQTAQTSVPGCALFNGYQKYTKETASTLEIEVIGADGTDAPPTATYSLSDPVETTNGGLTVGALNTTGTWPVQGKVTAFIILENPTSEQEAAVETILRHEYLGRGGFWDDNEVWVDGDIWGD
jgi:hypothetical protein